MSAEDVFIGFSLLHIHRPEGYEETGRGYPQISAKIAEITPLC
jgi:hypothetical protein